MTTNHVGIVNSDYSCVPSGSTCVPGTLKFGTYQSTVTTCCNTNNCNNDTATTDTNKLWCNFGQKGSQTFAAQSCPPNGSCAVKKFSHFFKPFFV